MNRRRAELACLALLLVLGCHRQTLDPFFYDPLPAPPGGYQLSTAIIPSWQSIKVHTPDQQQLDGVFIPSSGARPDVTLIYFHGQSNNLGTSWPRLEDLYPLGVNLVLVDPRGYGLSTGSPTEAGLHLDERAILAAVAAMPGVDPSRLVYYGRSMGSGLAVDLASTDPPAVLITESAFASIAAFVKDGAYVDLPSDFVSDSSWDNLDKVKTISSPYLLLHGTADQYVDPRYSRELAAAHEPAGPTDLVMVPGADHDDLPDVMGLDAYRARIAADLATWITSP